MENIIVHTALLEDISSSIENSDRIRIPVEYLKNYFQLVSSDILHILRMNYIILPRGILKNTLKNF